MLDLQVEIFILVGIGYLISKLGLFNKQTRKQVTDLLETLYYLWLLPRVS